MKKVLAALLALMMILTLTACGGKSDDVTGKYMCVSAKFSDGSGEPNGEWVELKNGGKGTYFTGNDGTEFDLEWKLDGEAFTGKVTFIGLENPMECTLKDGVLNVKYGDLDYSFAQEGAQVSAAAADNGIAGYYTLIAATMDGTSYTLEELRSINMADETYVSLEPDGTGELCFADDTPDSLTYDLSTGEMKFTDGTVWEFNVNDDTITVDMDGMIFVFGMATGSSSPSGSASGAPDHSDFFSGVTVASTIEDAFAGAGSSSNGFVSQTTSFEVGSRWYGTLALTNYVGANNEDTFVDAYGVFGKTDSGDTYFEIYLTEDHSDDSPALSYYIDLYDDYFVPIIGDDDAWIFSGLRPTTTPMRAMRYSVASGKCVKEIQYTLI